MPGQGPTLCEWCYLPLDVNDPDTVRAIRSVEAPGRDGGAPELLEDAEVLFHGEHFHEQLFGRRYRRLP